MTRSDRLGPCGGSYDVLEIYLQYCDILSSDNQASTKESLSTLSKLFNNGGRMRDTITDAILKLMSYIDVKDDFHHFTIFYNFVFFICRENGQKSITVQRAVAAWRIVLRGKFKLLDHWCNFIEKHHRYNISEDTWQQLLPFSKCIGEDLNGYDPQAAWPFLIDEFVDHMRSISQSKSNYSTEDAMSYHGGMDLHLSISDTFNGLNLHPASKRKWPTDDHGDNMDISTILESTHLLPSKRQKGSSAAVNSSFPEPDEQTVLPGSSTDWPRHVYMQHPRIQSAPCLVEGSAMNGVQVYNIPVGFCIKHCQNKGASYI